MSYLVLARKSRPQDFSQVVGQKPVVKTLQNSILKDRIAHAILFSGVRGVGKTTLARIMAKAINCEDRNGANPCNVCPSCTAITSGSSIDLYEIDGASNRGIQEIRELKEKIKFLPTSSRYKVIIIDEVHMLTTEAFNALLKTLEEPPAHVHFMFATTELHKIPVTILSRCQRYELKRVPASELDAHFRKLCESEGFSMEQAALDLIVRESEGSVRDGLSLLDQVFAYGEKKISADDVIQVLGLVSREIIHQLTESLLNKDPAKAFATLENALNFGVDLKRFSQDLLNSFRTLIFCRIDGCRELVDIPEQELNFYLKLAGLHSHATLHMKMNILMKGVEEMQHSQQPRLTLESTFLKCIAADDVVELTDILGKFDSLLTNSDLPSTKKVPTATDTGKKKTSDIELTADEGSVKSVNGLKAMEEPPLPTEPEEKNVSARKIVPQPHQHDVRRDWHGFIKHVSERKKWMAQDLQRAESAREVNGELQLHYSDHHNCAVLRQKDNIILLTEFVLDFFQKELKLKFITPDRTTEEENGDTNSPHLMRQKLANDPLVLMTTEIFNGQIGDIRVGPRSR